MKIQALRTLVLQHFPVFAGLSAARLDALIAAGHHAEVPSGTVLFDAHEPCRGFPLLLKGAVRVVKTAANGREILLYRVEPGDGCILSGGCLLGQSDYSATGIAETDVSLLVLPGEAFHALLLEYEPFRKFVFSLYGMRLAEIMELVEEVAFRRLDQRLAQLLIRRGPVIEETHQALADEVGSVREIVSRLLRSFETRGWVVLSRERIEVTDPKALSGIAQG